MLSAKVLVLVFIICISKELLLLLLLTSGGNSVEACENFNREAVKFIFMAF